MTRLTLKLPPRTGETAQPKPPTSRQRRALHGHKPGVTAPTEASAATKARTATAPRTAPARTVPAARIATPRREPRSEAAAPTP